MIYEADWVLPITAAPIRRGAVRVEGGAVADVGPAGEVRARYPEDPVTSFHHAILMPGFVNAHVHLDYTVFRGLFDDCNFGDWMLHFMVAKRKLRAADYAASAMLGAMECVTSGITAIGDTVFDGEATVKAANALGLRAYAFAEAFGMDDAHVAGAVEQAARRVAHLRNIAGPLVSIGLSPHAPYTVSGPLYRALTAYALREGLKVATHVAESQAEVTFVRNGSGVLAHDFRELVGWDDLMWMPTGTSPIKYLEQWDAFDADVIAIHCVQVSPSDIEVLRKYDVAIAHCPKSNAKLACGIAPVSDFVAAGLRVGIGTDSLASNNILDMFDEMRMTIFLHRASQASAACMTAEQVLAMATLGGAQVLGLADKVGSLEPGKRADMIAVDMEYSHFAPIDDPVSALVYGANQEDVFFSMIDGRVVYDKKVLTTVDADAVTREAEAVRLKLRS
ncbi:MAG: amidohydrolase family protein [Thermoleophilia bacterium]|nr:amidohydrolase family protein [Actinomycetota bacterium]